MKVILLGAPGAGKGTIAKLLTDYDGSVQISTGDILRAAVKAGTPVGKEAKAYMDAGGLVPDSIIMRIMEARLQEPDCKKGFILDGFPRTIPQAEELKKLLTKLSITLDLVVNLDIPREVILDRSPPNGPVPMPPARRFTISRVIPQNRTEPAKNAGAQPFSGMMKLRKQSSTDWKLTTRRPRRLLVFIERKGYLKILPH